MNIAYKDSESFLATMDHGRFWKVIVDVYHDGITAIGSPFLSCQKGKMYRSLLSWALAMIHKNDQILATLQEHYLHMPSAAFGYRLSGDC